MIFPLRQLHRMEHSKPLVQIDDSDKWIQWDSCDLEGLQSERIGKTVHDMGKIPKGQYDNLPEKFTTIDGKEYKIEDIHSVRTSKDL